MKVICLKANRRFELAILFLFVLISFTACKKVWRPIPENSGIVYNPYGYQSISDVLHSSSGDTYFLGAQKELMVLTKTNAQQQQVWQFAVPGISYYHNSFLLENSKGQLVVVGNEEFDTMMSSGTDLRIVRYSSAGELLHARNYSILRRDSFTGENYLTNSLNPSYCNDGSGGYYFVLDSYHNNKSNTYIVHYNINDTIDYKVSLTQSSAFYSGVLYYSLLNNASGDLILYYYHFSQKGIYVEKFDKAKFASDTLVSLWRNSLGSIDGNYISAVADNHFTYLSHTKLNAEQTYTLGLRIIKIDNSDGKTIKEWLNPTFAAIGNTSPYIGSDMLVDKESVYALLGAGNEIFVLSSSKSGDNFKSTQIGGNLSRDINGMMKKDGDNIMVLGQSSNNRSPLTTQFLCRLDKNGKIFSNR